MNKKKVVIIGANEFQNPLILKAKEEGYETHVFSWGKGEIGEQTADYFYPISIIEKEYILKKCKEIKPDAVLSIGSDLATWTVNYVCDDLKLISNSYSKCLQCTNKFEMRKKFKENGIKVPSFVKVKNINELPSKNNFPKIVKPTDRSGSRAIALVNNNEELNSAVKNAISVSFNKEAIIEDVISGEREFSCETISYNGQHFILAVTQKYTTGFPNCIEKGHIQPANLSKEEMNNLNTFIPKALNSLDIKFGPSHTEFKINSKGEICVIEIGARMGGDCIGSDLVKLSTGYDFLKMTLDVSLNKQPKLIQKKHNNFSIIRFIFTKNDIQKYKKIKEKYPSIIFRDNIKNEYNDVIDSSTRNGFYILTFNDEKIKKYLIKDLRLFDD